MTVNCPQKVRLLGLVQSVHFKGIFVFFYFKIRYLLVEQSALAFVLGEIFLYQPEYRAG